jgi:histidinol-phosphate aminotransferase
MKDHLRSISRASERHLGREGFVGLDRNERVSPIPETQFREMLASLKMEDLTAYPDAGAFVSRISAATKLPEDWIAETAGADAGIRRLFMAYLRPGDGLVTLKPSYTMYEIYGRMFQGDLKRVECRNDRCCDPDTLLAAITPGVRLVVLANPNQPTGTALDVNDLRKVVSRAGEIGAVCVIDEAYYPFSPQTAAPLLQEFDNLVVLRSFSKYPGCAGIRIGYALANPRIIQGLMAVRGGSEVSGVSLALACYLLDHPEIAENFRQAAEQGRRMLDETALRLGLEPLACVTNFQLVRCPTADSAVAVADALKAHRYLVRADFSHPSLENCMRISLNGPDVMTPFLVALEEAVLESRGATRRNSAR